MMSSLILAYSYFNNYIGVTNSKMSLHFATLIKEVVIAGSYLHKVTGW
jgi:hypothetical protein